MAILFCFLSLYNQNANTNANTWCEATVWDIWQQQQRLFQAHRGFQNSAPVLAAHLHLSLSLKTHKKTNSSNKNNKPNKKYTVTVVMMIKNLTVTGPVRIFPREAKNWSWSVRVWHIKGKECARWQTLASLYCVTVYSLVRSSLVESLARKAVMLRLVDLLLL